jgi:hypothetical protein
VCCLKSDEFYILNIIFVSKISTLWSVDLLYLLNSLLKIQVTEGDVLFSPVLEDRMWLCSRFDRCFDGDITPDTLSVGGWLDPSSGVPRNFSGAEGGFHQDFFGGFNKFS